ncbi:MAG TPA: DNA-3-methyladenine glycosylase I [Geminicoccaceae bacterium]|nr:DNA-3-methyladenine glycosylase I [Geminicoccaceae bacterium]
MAEPYCLVARGHPVHGPFHDAEHGFPVHSDAALLERLALEINQAGLSWLVALRRREGLARAFAGYDLDAVAAYGEPEVRRLLADPGVIRHRRKIEAVIENARRMVALRERHGSARAWFDLHHPLPPEGWLKLLRRQFVFVGPEIVNELLLGIGYLPGAHIPECPIRPKVIAANPPWLHAARQGVVGGEG